MVRPRLRGERKNKDGNDRAISEMGRQTGGSRLPLLSHTARYTSRNFCAVLAYSAVWRYVCAFVRVCVCVCVCVRWCSCAFQSERFNPLTPAEGPHPPTISLTWSTNTLRCPTIWTSPCYQSVKVCICLLPASRLTLTVRRISWPDIKRGCLN